MPTAERTRPHFATSKKKAPAPIAHVPVGAITIYTDGSCVGNGRRDAAGGYACVVPDRQELSGGWPLLDGQTPTNNRAEFAAFIKAAKIADELDPPTADPKDARTLLVVTDSELLEKTVSRWLGPWRKRGWVKADGSPVANRDMCEKMAAACDRRAVVVRHVRAHTAGEDEDSRMNRAADTLATEACKRQSRVAFESSI
jgi:ribonuclease HI